MAEKRRTSWLYYAIIVLSCEKTIQHSFVAIALYRDWNNIRSRLAVSPNALMISGVVLAVLFAFSLWGMVSHANWTMNLLTGLALIDIIGEFIAQGTFFIAITVSFLVVCLLLILTLFYRRMV